MMRRPAGGPLSRIGYTFVSGLLLAFLMTPTATPAPAAGARTARQVQGVVFDDANRNGRHDSGEVGLPGLVVSDLRDVAVTGPDGRYTLTAAPDAAVLFVSLPDGWSPVGRFW